MMECSECGSMNFESVGYEDGGGDDGGGFTEVWKCADCGGVTYGRDIYSADELLVNIIDDDQQAPASSGWDDGTILRDPGEYYDWDSRRDGLLPDP